MRVVAARFALHLGTFLLVLSGCTFSPGDGERIAVASQPVTFSGYVTTSAGLVRLEALDAAGNWTEIARAVASTSNANTRGSTPLYGYSLQKQVPKAYWEALHANGKREYHAQLRMRTGDVTTATFTAAGQACAFGAYASGSKTDLYEIGRACTTGSTIRLIADAMSRAQADAGKDGFLCAGQGSSCDWQPKLKVSPLSLGGCRPTYELNLAVENVGDADADQDLITNIIASGTTWNVTCRTDDTGRTGCVQSGTVPVPFMASNFRSDRVRLAPGAKTFLIFSTTLPIPAYASSVEIKVDGDPFPGVWTWQRPTPPTMKDHPFSEVCIAGTASGDAGG